MKLAEINLTLNRLARSLHTSRDGTPATDCLQEFGCKAKLALEDIRFWVQG